MKRKVDRCRRQKTPTLALTTALAVMVQTAAAQTISEPQQGPYHWISGNQSVVSTVSGGDAGVAPSGSVGTLTNSGMIGGNL